MLAEQGVVLLHGLLTHACTSEVTSYCWVELEAYVLKSLVVCSGFLVLWACVYKLTCLLLLEASNFMRMVKGVRQEESHLSHN